MHPPSALSIVDSSMLLSETEVRCVYLLVSGAVKASEAADAWAAVLDRMEEAWGAGKGSIPPLRVYMRLGSLYNSLGRTNEAKVRQLSAYQCAGYDFSTRRCSRHTIDIVTYEHDAVLHRHVISSMSVT